MNEQNKRLEDIKKRCKTSKKVLSVLQGFVIAGLVISLIAGIYMLVGESTINPQLQDAYEKGYVTGYDIHMNGLFSGEFEFSHYYEEGNFTFPIFVTCMIGAAYCVITLVILSILKSVFSTLMTKENPFSDKIFSKIKITFIIITVSVLISIGGGCALIAGLLFWCIYSILKYGAALQTEIDETL